MFAEKHWQIHRTPFLHTPVTIYGNSYFHHFRTLLLQQAYQGVGNMSDGLIRVLFFDLKFSKFVLCMNMKYNVVGGLFLFDVLKYKYIFRVLLENRALLEIEEQR